MLTGSPRAEAAQMFGTHLVAMVTPMDPEGRVSEPDTRRLVDHLVAGGCDGIVVAGTTGEAPTLTEDELGDLVRLVVSQVQGRARVVAGVGTNDTASSTRRAVLAQQAGADALLVVAPYYSRPTQAGILRHLTTVADATALPVMVYDVPARTGVALAPETLVELAGHPRIHAVKDAKGDLPEAMSVMAQTSLAYYCGVDELNLPYLACGATGLVSVVSHVAAAQNARLLATVREGDLPTARRLHAALLPLIGGMMHEGQGAATSKATLARLGVIAHDTVRGPLVETDAEVAGRLAEVATLAAVPPAAA